MAQATFSHTVNVAVSNQDGVLKSFDWVADVGAKAYGGKAWVTDCDMPTRYNLTMDNSEIAGDVVSTITPLEDSSPCSPSVLSGCSVALMVVWGGHVAGGGCVLLLPADMGGASWPNGDDRPWLSS
jgi:hypothetical protein